MLWVIGLAMIVLGWGLGWVVNYLSDTLLFTRRFTAPHCMTCQSELSWSDYLAYRPCPGCQARRSTRTWVVQILAVVFTVWLWFFPPGPLGFWLGVLLLAYLGLIVVMDLEHRVVLNEVAIAGALIGLGIGVYLHGLWKTLAGGAAGFALMALLFFLGAWFSRRMARRRGEEEVEDALGFGDVNLSGILGLVMGWPLVFASLLLGIVLGGVFSGLFILTAVLRRRYTPFMAIPYAPFLVLGTVLLLYLPSVLR